MEENDQLKFLVSMLPGTAILFLLPVMHPIVIATIGFFTSYLTCILFDNLNRQTMKKEEDNYTLRCCKCNTQTLIVSYPPKTKLQGLRCMQPCGGKLMVMKFYRCIDGEYYYHTYKGDIYKLDERGNFHLHEENLNFNGVPYTTLELKNPLQ